MTHQSPVMRSSCLLEFKTSWTTSVRSGRQRMRWHPVRQGSIYWIKPSSFIWLSFVWQCNGSKISPVVFHHSSTVCIFPKSCRLFLLCLELCTCLDLQKTWQSSRMKSSRCLCLVKSFNTQTYADQLTNPLLQGLLDFTRPSFICITKVFNFLAFL